MLTVYQAQPSSQQAATDALLAQWWVQLTESGELDDTLGKGCQALSEFYKLLTTKDRLLIFDTDDLGISMIFLISPLMNSAFLTVWLAPRHRASREALLTMEAAYNQVFQVYPVILGVTSQESKLKVHQHWGYAILGEVPAIFDGKKAWIVMLTREAFEAAMEERNGRRLPS